MLKKLKLLIAKIKDFFLLKRQSKNYIHYMASGESLPQPFSREEEEEKIALLLRGENGAREQLIEHNLRLVVYIARKFDNTGIDLDDLISVGTIGLIKAVNTFNAASNTSCALKAFFSKSMKGLK